MGWTKKNSENILGGRTMRKHVAVGMKHGDVTE